MYWFLCALIGISCCFAGIHKTDDRYDLFERPELKQYFDATAAQIRKSYIQDYDQDYFVIKRRPLSVFLPKPLCQEDRYGRQISVADCSGFLIADDLLVTAGHCMSSEYSSPEDYCRWSYWVFDYYATVDNSDIKYTEIYDADYDYWDLFADKVIKRSSVYSCKEVLVSSFTPNIPLERPHFDFAVVRLDRPVGDRRPLVVGNNFLTEGDPVMAIGYPLGLPAKVAINAQVKNLDNPTTFATDLDAFQNNSGSAVLNANTMAVEGIIIRGLPDYYRWGDCYEPFVAEDDGGYIKVFRMDYVMQALEQKGIKVQ